MWAHNILYFLVICCILSHYDEDLRSLIAQSVICLTADTCLSADLGIASSILPLSHTFLEIDHEIMSTAILLPSADSRRVVITYKGKNVQEALVNRLVKLIQEKLWLSELIIPAWP